ncbi:MAG TPA: hypothetical protein ENJ20_02770, partial [Bacteroidetes bacterium]|nr:hypothetical protein [Bacteroidota bacterium]
MSGQMRILFFIMTSIWLAVVATAQEPFFKIYEPGESFSNVNIELVYEDRNGQIWFGSDGGVFLFDGIYFQSFIKTDSSTNHVRSIYRDRGGRLWAGYADGSVFYLENKQLVQWLPEEGTPSAPVIGFAEDGEGRFWLATYGEGLYYMEGGRMHQIGPEEGLLGNDIYCLARDARGRMWVGTDAGISICWVENGQKSIHNLTREEGLPDDIVQAIVHANDTTTWIGTYDGWVVRYNPVEGTFSYLKKKSPFGPITSLEYFEEKEIWAGTERGGVYRYSLEENRWSHLKQGGHSKIFDLHKDIEGNIWVLSYDRGILSANRQFELIQHGLSNVQAILMDKENRLWVGSQDGLFRYHTRDDRFVRHLKGFSLNIISLYQDTFGNLLIGTFDKGLFYYRPSTGTVRQLTENDGITNNNILSIDGTGGKVWLATLGGVTEMNYDADPDREGTFRFRSLTRESGLGTNFIYKVFVDSKKRAWFGTDGKGISVLENGRIKNYPVAVHQHDGESGEKSIPLRAVYSITEDRRGHIWLSTKDAGIFEFDGTRFHHLTVKEGLREMEITSLATDANGQIIIVHPTGIDVLTPENKHLIYYDKDVGIENLDPHLNAICTDGFGNVWVAGQHTIVKYSALAEDLEIHPRTLLRNVSIFLEPVDFYHTNSFGCDQNNLIFDYVGLWYTDPDVVKYRYRLKGYDLDWIESKDRRATYSNLPPGRYTFEVMSTENDAWLDEPVVSYSFAIRPP